MVRVRGLVGVMVEVMVEGGLVGVVVGVVVGVGVVAVVVRWLAVPRSYQQRRCRSGRSSCCSCGALQPCGRT